MDMIKKLNKYKIKLISSIAILAVGIFGMRLGGWLEDKKRNDLINSVPEFHEGQMYDENTDMIGNDGLYEIWVLAYDENMNQIINVNFKTDNRVNGEMLTEDLDSFDGYNVSVNKGNYWFVDEINGVKPNGDQYFSVNSPWHKSCKDNDTINGGQPARLHTCNTTVEWLYLDETNVFIYYITDSEY